MSATVEEFLCRFVLAEAESEPDSDPPDVDPYEAAVKAGISPEQIERLNRAIDEANAYRAAQND